MKIEKIGLPECPHATGLVVAVDVIRAFTTAAFAFGRGIQEIITVGTVEEALALRKEDPSLLLMGEAGGKPIAGFDFGNSPVEIHKADLLGKRLVQRTSAGTQGIVGSKKADRILAASFVVAEATVRRILGLASSKVTFVITGTNTGDEDLALADYLEQRLLGLKPDPAPYLKRVKNAPEASEILAQPWCPDTFADDIRAAMEIDRFPFAMEVERGNRLVPK